MNEYGSLYSRLYIVNSTDKFLEVFEDDVKLNDIEVKGYIYEDEMAPGCVLICDLEYEDDSLEEAEIGSLDEVTAVSFSLEFDEMDSYKTVTDTGVINIDLE